jgi:hypothetical protein
MCAHSVDEIRAEPSLIGFRCKISDRRKTPQPTKDSILGFWVFFLVFSQKKLMIDKN